MPARLSPAEISAKLAAVQSGEVHYKHTFGMHYTEGVKTMAELCGAYWLIDAIASHQIYPRVRREDFQVWTLKVKPDHRAVLRCTDGNNNQVRMQMIPYTDFPIPEITVWVEGGVALLPREH